jgi:hypothetical protein
MLTKEEVEDLPKNVKRAGGFEFINTSKEVLFHKNTFLLVKKDSRKVWIVVFWLGFKMVKMFLLNFGTEVTTKWTQTKWLSRLLLLWLSKMHVKRATSCDPRTYDESRSGNS